MALTAGTRLGLYEVVAILGAGGMGEVYRARDTKLGREVALKVLPEAFAFDAERVARFKREAQVLASLNHPHIAALYGMEEAEGRHFLIMELVEGETLAERLRRGAIRVEDALTIAHQIADALEAAHEKTVVHRDLKPANVKITPDEKVKVLDFGLAKAFNPAEAGSHVRVGARADAATNSPTLSMMATQAGIILGTAAYMSPEQAQGLGTDARSDVFSFGSVLYEMLTGRQAFQEQTAAAMMAAVLMREPDLSTLPPNLNPRLAELLKRCLQKNPKQRWQAVGDLRAEIEAVKSAPLAVPIPAQVATPPRPLWRRAVAGLIAAVVFAAIGGTVAWSLKQPPPGPVVRFPFVLPEGQQFTRTPSVLAISPDGTRLAYVANQQLFLRAMNEAEARPIQGSNLDVLFPSFSPNGQWIAFFAFQDQTLKKIAVSGGAPVTLARLSANPYGVRWDGNWIVYGQPNGVYRVSENSGEPELIVETKPPELVSHPQLLDNGRTVLFTLTTESGDERWDKAQVVLQSLPSGERKILVRGGSAAVYVPTGHLLYATGATIFALPLDLPAAAPRGGPVPVLDGVQRSTSPSTLTAVAAFAVSNSGSLIYLPGGLGGTSGRMLATIDLNGAARTLDLPARGYSQPRVSPDGSQLAVAADDGLWIYDLKRGGQARRLTLDGRNSRPVWASDSRRIAFSSERGSERGIYWQPADGSRAPELLVQAEAGVDLRPEAWASDGVTLAYARVGQDGNSDIWTLLTDRDQKPKPLLEGPSQERSAAFSPDGRWLAYAASRVGSTYQIFVQPFPPTGPPYQVPTGRSAGQPVWISSGRLLYYEFTTRQIMIVDINTQPAVRFSVPAPIQNYVGPASTAGDPRHYDVTPDRKQVIAVLPSALTTGRPQIDVVLNWLDELKRLVPEN